MQDCLQNRKYSPKQKKYIPYLCLCLGWTVKLRVFICSHWSNSTYCIDTTSFGNFLDVPRRKGNREVCVSPSSPSTIGSFSTFLCWSFFFFYFCQTVLSIWLMQKSSVVGPVRLITSLTEILVNTLCLDKRLEGSMASIHVFAGGKGAEPGICAAYPAQKNSHSRNHG